jgi:hypothetical protein
MTTTTMRLAAAGVAALALTGCGAGSAMVGVHDAPSETTTTAPVASEAATKVAARVLADAARARAATGAEAKELRAKALTGGALTVSSADSRLAKAGSPTPEPVTKPEAPKVLAISRGSSFPRVMLVQSTREDGAAVLNLLVSEAATAPFKLAASAPMQPGTSVAALHALDAGSPLNPDGKGLPVSPEALLTEYAASLSYPKPAAPSHVQAGDRFAEQVRANAKSQGRSLDKLATLTQKHAPRPKDTMAIALKDGGAVVFGLMERVDTITLKPSGKSLTPNADFQRLIGKKTLTERAEMRTFETVVFTVPKEGKASLVAVDEALVSAKGE